jgi:Abortive infection alpha/Protein of unknown function (DUF2806)
MWQWQNRIRIAERAQRIMEEKKIAVKILPPDFLIPLIRDCGDVSDETLQEAWARLLAEAVSNDEAQHISYVHTLKQLSPNDAKVALALIEAGPVSRDERLDELAKLTSLTPEQVKVSIHNFEHLGFFTPTTRRLKGYALNFLRICISDDKAIDEYVSKQKKLTPKAIFD